MTPIQSAGEAMPEVKATDEQINSAFRDLEHDICCLSHMADILDHLLDDHLVDFETRGFRHGGIQTIKLTGAELETLAFAWKDVSFRAARVRDAFFAAGNGEVIQ